MIEIKNKIYIVIYMTDYNREYCVLCINNLKLIPIKSLEHPNYDCVDINTINNNCTIEYSYCENCFSIQLSKLVDPEILYDKNYFQPLNNSYLWIQHNISFINFIINNLDTDINKSIIEIGSSSFCLGKHLINYYTDYTVFDYSINQAIIYDNVKYIEGNCENYNFPENSNIVMSHVFEHLYNPKVFIKNCCLNKVKNIFITIPSMNDLQQLHVNNQHTFTYTDNDIEYIFGLYNYKLNTKLLWNSNDNSFPCLFFHFTLHNSILDIKRYINESRYIYTYNLLNNKIIIPPNTFLSTCVTGSFIIYNLIENKENIIGIIDLNINKQGKKFGSTNILIYPYEYLKNFDNNTSILIFHQKKNNIISLVKNNNPNINIILL
jgi:hypothetical protein